MPNGFNYSSDLSRITINSEPIVGELRHPWKEYLSAAIRQSRFDDWASLEAHLTKFVVIQTHLFRRFYLTVDFLGLRRSRSWPQIINQAQNSPE